jgi:hypothetical protein
VIGVAVRDDNRVDAAVLQPVQVGQQIARAGAEAHARVNQDVAASGGEDQAGATDVRAA